MASLSHSLVSIFALLGVAPLSSALSVPLKKTTFIPRQATPGFSGCEYPAGWKSCNTKDRRDCWVIDDNGFEYNITTDYEDFVPEGTTRNYDLTLTEKPWNADGTVKPLAKLINGKFPGELIEACWGDTVLINIKNQLPTNGTTMHWHGIRQLHTVQMDGVNGITQCPVAEGDTYQYKFKIMQYGTSWYHSHYSAQYSDGVAGPMLIHGPNSDNWDEEWEPIMVTDWLHNTAFEEYHKEHFGNGKLPQADSILLNGKGRFNGKGEYYINKFEAGKKYLIRIINASTSLHFHFSIDGHKFKVISTDFVPIKPYETNSLSVGIGQRYNVIVEAKPETPSSNGKYWIRTEYTGGTCNGGQVRGAPLGDADPARDNQRVGIISYMDATGTDNPTSTRTQVEPDCLDEPFDKLEPIVKWSVSAPQNDIKGAVFEAGLDFKDKRMQRMGVNHWTITDTAMWLNPSSPTILNLANTTWDPEYAVVDYNYDDGDNMVYMVITSGNHSTRSNKLATDHPIHLHGHDFAVIGQKANELYDPQRTPLTFKLNNPPRRDTAMLPRGGYLAIAFKPDNPGIWALHCHIAWHAGSGLALQIMERHTEIARANGDSSGAFTTIREGCQKWDKWLLKNPHKFNETMRDDSGI